MYCTRKVTDDLIWVGADDRRLACFEGVYGVPDGVSYNSYVMLDEKTAIFDTVDKAVYQTYFENVAHALGGRRPDYLVISHMEPDHAYTIEALLLRYPELKLVCNSKIETMLKNFFRGVDFTDRLHIVKEGDVLELGRHKISFVMAPMVHWPEVMMSYDSDRRHTLLGGRVRHLRRAQRPPVRGRDATSSPNMSTRRGGIIQTSSASTACRCRLC